MVLLLNCARLTGCHSTSRNERTSVLCFERIKYVSTTLTCLRRLRLSQRLMSNTRFTSIMKMSPAKLLTPLEPAPHLLARVHQNKILKHCCQLTKGTTWLFFSSIYTFCCFSKVSMVEWLWRQINCAIARGEKRKWFRKVCKNKWRKM